MSKSEKHHQLLAGLAGMGACLAYSPETAAVVSGRSRTRIFLAIKNGELAAKKDGRATLIEADELRRWVRQLPAKEALSNAAI